MATPSRQFLHSYPSVWQCVAWNVALVYSLAVLLHTHSTPAEIQRGGNTQATWSGLGTIVGRPEDPTPFYSCYSRRGKVAHHLRIAHWSPSPSCRTYAGKSAQSCRPCMHVQYISCTPLFASAMRLMYDRLSCAAHSPHSPCTPRRPSQISPDIRGLIRQCPRKCISDQPLALLAPYTHPSSNSHAQH